MSRTGWKTLVAFLAFVLFMGMAGTALAWEYSQSYTSSTLYGGPQGKPWSPSGGILQADVHNVSGNRRTNPVGNLVYWGTAALNYIRNNGQWVSITFHSFNINNGCSSFAVLDMAGTNLPAPQVNKYWRAPCAPLTFRYTEVRIASTNANLMQPWTSYWGQGFYQDNNTTTTRQKITVDTYYGGQENWHQTYCINVGSFVASVC